MQLALARLVQRRQRPNVATRAHPRLPFFVRSRARSSAGVSSPRRTNRQPRGSGGRRRVGAGAAGAARAATRSRCSARACARLERERERERPCAHPGRAS